MSRKQKIKRLLIAVLLAAVLGGGAWYSRPVDLYALMPSRLAEPVTCDLKISRYVDTSVPYEDRSLRLEPGTADYDAVIAKLDTLRFRRSPLDLLRPSDRRSGPASIEVGDFRWYLTMCGADAQQELQILDLRLWSGQWAYILPRNGTGTFRAIRQCGGEDARELSAYLWTLAGEQEAAP